MPPSRNISNEDTETNDNREKGQLAYIVRPKVVVHTEMLFGRRPHGRALLYGNFCHFCGLKDERGERRGRQAGKTVLWRAV
ncbi:hypothetical protein LTR60_002242, partial [Cryomyces antarcticus]